MSKKRAIRNTNAWKKNRKSPSGIAGHSGETMAEKSRRKAIEAEQVARFYRAMETGNPDELFRR